MRIINGLNYTHKLNKMVEECYLKANENPFESYLFITEDPYILEQYFFQHTHHLVNIEIMTWSKFLQQLTIDNHLTQHHVLTHTEWTYYLYQILNQESFHCFHNKHPYPLIEKLIPLLKSFNLNQTYYQEETFTQLKLQDFIHLYHSIQNHLDELTHMTQESLLDQNLLQSPYQHIYIEGDHLVEAKRQKLIKRLSENSEITLLYTHSHDPRLLNLPYHQLCSETQEDLEPNVFTEQLFLQGAVKPLSNHQYLTFFESTPQQEVKRVIYTIQQKVIDEGLQYQDFMIVYPDSSYKHLLINTLMTLNIPHDLTIDEACLYDYDYQKILTLIDTFDHSTIAQMAKKLNLEELEQSYHIYLESLFDYDMPMTNQEFKDFFQATYLNDHHERLNNQDHVAVRSIDQVRSAKPIHIFFLGMNETTFPRLIKDTDLLLDEDIKILRDEHLTTSLNTTEQLGIHYNDILKALLQPSLTMTFSYFQQTLSGETLLPSSLYKQLEQLLTLKPLPVLQYLPVDDYYQTGGFIQEKEILNQNIQSYLDQKNQPQNLPNELIQQLYSPTLSVSQIETYNKCPFQYFIQYGLGIYPKQKDIFMPNELGSLIHYVLSVNLDHTQDIHTLVKDYIEHNQILNTKVHASPVNQYFIEQLEKDLAITLTVLKRQLILSEFQVHDQEKKVEQDIHGIHFKGFVDRIDEFQNYISIIDYKSSAKDIDLNLAIQGFNIQMLLYLKMVTETYQKDPGAVLYFNTKKRILSVDNNINEPIDEEDFYQQYRFGGYVIDDENHQVIMAIDPTLEKKSGVVNVTYVKSKDEYKGHILTQGQLEILLQHIEEHVYELYTQMLNGHIGINPKGSDQSNTHDLVNPCRYCPYHSICSFDVFYNDYSLVEFLDVEELLGGKTDGI